MNQIMAQLAGSAGFCLSVHIHRASVVPCGTRSNAASGGYETALACSGACIQRNELHPKNILCKCSWKVNSTTIFKKLLRQDGKTELGGGHSLNETLNRWKLILRVYESVAIYKK